MTKLKEKEEIKEFKASHGDPSEIPDPIPTKSSKRPADKTVGDKAVPKVNRASSIDKIMNYLTTASPAEVAAAEKTMFGKNAPDNAKKNKATIKGTKFVEDVKEIFGDDETITEEFLEKTSIIFEAAVMARVKAETVRIEEEMTEYVDEQVEQRLEEVEDNVDKYLSHAANKWLEENQVEIESEVKVELAESLLKGMTELLEVHNIQIDDEKIDLVKEAEAKNEELSKQLDEAHKKLLESENTKESATKETYIGKISKDLTIVEQDKLCKLVEGIDADNIEDWQSKVDVIFENYFDNTDYINNDNAIDDAEVDLEEEVKQSKSPKSNYVKFIEETQ